MRQKSFDNYLLTIMSIVALLSLYMLYGTKLVSFNSSEELKVASIIEQLKTVKRKRDFYQGWVDVKQGDNLSQNDEIYTHGQSSAKIRFTNGPEISLFENSLLRIKTAAKGSTLSLDKGNLIATLNKESPNLNIELAGKKYSFNSENANIQIEQGKTENKFLLLDGKAKLADKEILPNQVVIQNIKTGKMEIKAIPFVLKFPENNKVQYFVKETSMKFSWTYTNGEVPAKLMIARDSDFTDIVSSDAGDVERFAEAGTYYWKVISDTEIASPIRSFTLIEEMQPALSADKEIVYVGPKSKEKIFLNWSKNNGKKFLMRIEDSSGGRKEIAISKNHYEFNPPAASSYKLSVKINDENRPLALWSEPVFIDVKEAASITINSLTPDLIEKVNYKNEATNFMLSWNGPSGSVNYKVRLTKNGKTIENETDHTSLPLNLKEAGEYAWEVTGETLSGVISNKITGKIIIKNPLRVATLPAEGAVVELDKPDQMVNFKWDKVDEATQYQFELSDEPTFKKIMVDREIDSNNISTTLAETGKYFWRVRIKKGNKVEYSSPVSVEIKPSPPLTRPEISPDIKIKLKYMDEKSSSFNLLDLFFSKAEAADQIAIAEWDLPANPRAKSYTVEVYKDPELKELVIKIETELPHAVWKNAAPGKFYWRVLYNDFWGRKTEFSKVSVLSTEAEAPEEIELQNPKHRADILKRDGDSFVFEWNPIKNAKNYQLLIATDLEFENTVIKRQISQTEVKILCRDLKAGDYFWKVQSGESSSKRRQFGVQCEKPLPPVEPKPEPKIEMAEVKPAPVVLKVEEEKTNPRFLRAGLFPHTLTYSNKAKLYSAKVDGTVIDSWYLMYQSPLDLKYFQLIDTSLWVARGKVFKEITFTDIDFKVRAHRVQSSFSWGPVAAFMKKTLYVESNSAIVDESISSPLIGLFLQKEFRPFTFEAEVKAGSMINFQASLQYRLRNDISFGVLFDSTSLIKDENKHTFTKVGLNVNYTFDFLDKK